MQQGTTADDAREVSAWKGLQKAVGVDVDLEAHRAVHTDAGEPAAQHRLQIDLAPGLDEKPPAVTAAQHGKRRRCGAEHGDAGELRRRSRERAGSR